VKARSLLRVELAQIDPDPGQGISDPVHPSDVGVFGIQGGLRGQGQPGISMGLLGEGRRPGLGRSSGPRPGSHDPVGTPIGRWRGRRAGFARRPGRRRGRCEGFGVVLSERNFGHGPDKVTSGGQPMGRK
jgi:hypothetical protein